MVYADCAMAIKIVRPIQVQLVDAIASQTNLTLEDPCNNEAGPARARVIT